MNLASSCPRCRQDAGFTQPVRNLQYILADVLHNYIISSHEDGINWFQDRFPQHRVRGAGEKRAVGGHLRLSRRGHRRVLPRAIAGGRLPPPAQGWRRESRDGSDKSLDQVSATVFPTPFRISTGLGKRVVPRLRESLLLTPSGRRGRVHAT